MIKGSIVAIITPFTETGVNEEKLRELIEFQIKNGTNGIVPCGTTGESPTLTTEEHDRVIEVCIEAVNKRVPVIAGTGSNSTAEAIHLTQHAANAGADAALVVTPYYNKPTQKGLYLHFKAVADSVDIPIILYNIEGRCARNIETETVAKLAKACKNIVGVKEASGNLKQVADVRKACGDKFIILSGDDALTLPMMDLGGVGVISVVANIAPADVVKMIAAYNSGDKNTANKLNTKLLPLIKAMFVETNPSPVKAAAELMGLCSGKTRLPLCELEPENLEKVRTALKNYGLIG
ncbi:MAG: 4-hydroxy-tetrahydrodipicolinate synthase [Omnitrophica WOR_2 bacterium GWF2_38_59]|nr:MAG: 4-hydroxy-tetrahydrodipicolinate synthase [Omnitrophica WOR_2 bacterium GWF2_38_59]OGX49299.1 MAG: 4-hydroxy-tetrahydrodipicolinate synthase [Omnitrophica WOR_2 bacterium RIFOXYA2_FULL_38_17]OGX51467.1 MAG: 4-hydroxy-tetrahydrodipicolinate synthase [Omnitrophica WOR_2 bacterium RIFOXYA12_FULL_38_10]OGX58223.1 MAG: 4-hydroxy-tetrahydrodipicolinate synthase [Omnitrophica WOR_2 bacterium RIFOXYB2_FULL_38_16]HBG61881.1 4-hydroxy-tetrahydrodipicolinate synthase [Candidatus Omnitrophota bacte